MDRHIECIESSTSTEGRELYTMLYRLYSAFGFSKDTPKVKKKNPHFIQGIKTLVINFQSLWNKKVELSNLASDTTLS